MFEGDLEAAILGTERGAIVCWFIGDRPCDWEGDRDRTRWILKEQQPQHSEDWGSHHPWGERRHFLEGERVQRHHSGTRGAHHWKTRSTTAPSEDFMRNTHSRFRGCYNTTRIIEASPTGMHYQFLRAT